MRISIKGKTFYIDRKDWAPLKDLTWHVGQYVYTQVNNKSIYLHRLIMNPPKGLYVDHINRNPLDNRRKNLRIATQSQNMANQGIAKHNSSGYKGVSFHKASQKWQAYIECGKKIHIGCFASRDEAAHIYNQVAIQIFGDFARLNEIEVRL